MTIKKSFNKNSVFINFVFGLIAFISINIIFSKLLINKKIDLTEDNLFTLSTNTKNIIENLNEQIKIQFFFSESLSRDIPQIRDFECNRSIRLANSGSKKQCSNQFSEKKTFKSNTNDSK